MTLSGNRHVEGDWWPEPLPENVIVGDRVFLSSHSFLHYRSEQPVGVRIGDDCGLYTGTEFDLGPLGEVEIGDFCTIVAPVIATNGRVQIGNHVLISHDVFIVDSPVACPPDVAHRVGREDGAPSPTFVLDDLCWVSTRVILLPGCVLGRGAIVGAGSVVDFEVPPYAIVVGNPARIVGSAPPGGVAR